MVIMATVISSVTEPGESAFTLVSCGWTFMPARAQGSMHYYLDISIGLRVLTTRQLASTEPVTQDPPAEAAVSYDPASEVAFHQPCVGGNYLGVAIRRWDHWGAILEPGATSTIR
jgi:hypothetical protein